MTNEGDEPTPGPPNSSGDVSGNDGDDKSTKTRRKRRNRRQRNNRENNFAGETAEMNRNVFQTLTESNDRRQFTKTVEALERYINKKLRYPGDLKSLYQKLEMPTLVDPPDITEEDAKNMAKSLVWSEKKKSYLKRKQTMDDNMRDIFAVIWGQCSTVMQAKIRQVDEFEQRKTDADCGWLLSQIKSSIFQFEGRKQKFLAMVEARNVLDKV